MSTKKKLTNEDLPVKIIKDFKYESMYRLEWADGIASEDMYNLTWANDILNNYGVYRQNMKQRDPRFNNLIAFRRLEQS